RPALGDEVRNAQLRSRQALFARAPADTAELGARLRRPGRSAELLEPLQCFGDRVARRALEAQSPPDDAECEQRARPAVQIRTRLVVPDRLVEELFGTADVVLCGSDQAARPSRVPEGPFATYTSRVRLPAGDEVSRFFDTAQLEQQLRMIGRPPADGR